MRLNVAEPSLRGNEIDYVNQCLAEGWISSNGRFIVEFEEKFAQFAGTKYAVSTNNGTTALHLALIALGLKPGDEVIVPTLTYIATANAVVYCGATPVLVDADPDTMNIAIDQIESKITDRTVGIIPVHLYGHPAEMVEISKIAKKHNLWVVEDAAEAHAAEHYGRKVGSLGNCGVFSFFGNKIITTGEGGMITTNSESLMTRLKFLRSQGMSLEKRYWFPEVGYNYRMTNVQAAIGLAQLEQIDDFLARRIEISKLYNQLFSDFTAYVQTPFVKTGNKHVYWMYTINLKGKHAIFRDKLMNILDEKGIETRPVFYPMHQMPPYFDDKNKYDVADNLSGSGINLPTHVNLSDADIHYVVEAVKLGIETLQVNNSGEN